MTTGPERQWLKNAFASAKKQDAVIIHGKVKVTMSDELGYDGTEVDTIRFDACWDERSIVANRDGKTGHSDPWLVNRVKMHHKKNDPQGNRWTIFSQDDRSHNPKKSCVFN